MLIKAMLLVCLFLYYGVGVTVVVKEVLGVGVALPVPGATGVLFGTAVPGCVSGQASKFTGKSVQVLTSVQILRMRGVISGALQSTTCLPLFTSTVEQLVSLVVVEVVVVAGGETTSKVAVSGKISKA